jgi:hypothetical protein
VEVEIHAFITSALDENQLSAAYIIGFKTGTFSTNSAWVQQPVLVAFKKNVSPM